MKKVFYFLIFFGILYFSSLSVYAREYIYDTYVKHNSNLYTSYMTVGNYYSLYTSTKVSDNSPYWVTYKIPVELLQDDSFFRYVCSEQTMYEFLWSTYDLFDDSYWPSITGSVSKKISNDTSLYLDELSETKKVVTTTKTGVAGSVVDIVPYHRKDYGFYYIMLRSSYYDTNNLNLFIVNPSEPDLSPSPTPGQDLGDVGSASSQLGTFGTDNGTGNWVYTSFKSLYDNLYGIFSDKTTPDLDLPEGSFYDFGDSVQNNATSDFQIGSHEELFFMQNTQYLADSFISTISSFPEKRSVTVDKWTVDYGNSKEIDTTYRVSPDSVFIAESDATINQGYRDGNVYILNYKFRIPMRFNAVGHTGIATSSPMVFTNLRLEYAGSGYVGHYRFGTPTVYLESSADNLSYDTLNELAVTNFDDGSSWISGEVGFSIFDVPILNQNSKDTYFITLEFPVYVSDFNNPIVMINPFQYEASVYVQDFEYYMDIDFNHISDSTIDGTLSDIYQEQVNQNQKEDERYQEEQEKTQEAIDSATDGLGQVTDTLTSWEIFTLPFTLLKDFVTAIASDGETTLTFPSFQLMGATLWPSYTFDLMTVEKHFPLLVDSLHLIFGILVVIWFLRYLWRKWHIVTGDDLPEGEGE